MEKKERGHFSLRSEIWGDVEDPEEFCQKNKPIKELIKEGWEPKVFDWEAINRVTPGTGIIPRSDNMSFRVGFGEIWAPHLLREDMFLDVGCGPRGATSIDGRYVYGINPKLENPLVPARTIEAIAEDLPFEAETFDGILSDKTVGFYPRDIDYWSAIQEMLKALKQERFMIVRTGQHMTPELYRETEKRAKAAGHDGRFERQQNYFLIFKKNDNWEI